MSTVTLTAKQAFLLERWHQILNDPELDQYENFRIETNGNGEILMSPRPPKPHNFKATKIATMLVERLAVKPQLSLKSSLARVSKFPMLVGFIRTATPRLLIQILLSLHPRSALKSSRPAIHPTSSSTNAVCISLRAP